jgi:hypothetical protein
MTDLDLIKRLVWHINYHIEACGELCTDMDRLDELLCIARAKLRRQEDE